MALISDRRDMLAFCLAPLSASILVALVFGRPNMLGVDSVIAYVAALAVGYPLIYLFRRQGKSLAWCCTVSGLIAGGTIGLLLTLGVLYGAAPERFLSDPGNTAFNGALGTAIGAGLGLVSGVALLLMLRRSDLDRNRVRV